ncbi:Uncharacterised protein [Legionella beliardensis]|uniref:Uncharacterized protein n=1 Tax=Legionella beliardensis TaxID=91822 RepID=A0A378IBG9_9GAMM|nr:hypothetical protein [Legionella beliardensis]STX29644.1 Uncharacterised protein [Legionella beliardensis]
MLTLIGIIILASIIVFFSKEFGEFIEKLMDIRGVAIFLPLALASLVIIYYEAWILWGLLFVKIGLHSAASWLASILPFQSGQQGIATFILIYLITLIPITILFFQKKKKPFFYNPRLWIITALIWILLIITLTVGFY